MLAINHARYLPSFHALHNLGHAFDDALDRDACSPICLVKIQRH